MKLIALTIACIVVGVANGTLFRSSDKVNDLKTRGDLSALLTEPGGPQLVYIYDSLDVNCHKKASIISATGDALDGFVPVVSLDIRQPAFQWVLNAWGVQVIPSVGLLHGAVSPPTSTNAAAASKLVASHLNRYVGGGAKHMELFPHTKPITVDSLKKSALAALPDKGIERVSTVQALDKVFKAVWGSSSVLTNIPAEQAVVVLFTDKPKTSALFKSLSATYSGIIRFVEVVVKGSSSPVVKHDVFAGADASSFPALFVISSSEGTLSSARYPSDGTLSVSAISAFIDNAVGLTSNKVKRHVQMQHSITDNAHRRRSGVVAGVFEVNSQADWNEFVIRNAGVSKVVRGPIRIVFAADVKVLRTSLLNVVASTSSSVPKTIVLVDSAKQKAILGYFGESPDQSANVVIDVIPSLQSDAAVYKYGVHPASLGTEAYLEKPAMKRNLKLLNWGEVPEFRD